MTPTVDTTPEPLANPVTPRLTELARSLATDVATELATDLALPHAADPGLATALREGTREAHRDAERGPFVHALIRGQLARPVYLDYLRALATIYAALEASLARHADHPIVGPLARPELLRGPAIARDLATLGAAAQPPVAAARAYADRLHALADHHPALLVAHAYTRYLGDLSGGQLLRRGAARALGIGPEHPEHPGLDFYAFREIADLDAYKRELRACLDALPVDATTAAAIVDEARRAFTDTASIFAALAPSE